MATALIMPEEETPSYEEMIDYYLRDDVSQVLWEISNRRLLKFFYHSERDLRPTSMIFAYRPHAISLHCLENPEEFRNRLKKAAARANKNVAGFCPFFRMGNTVCEPGKADQPIGFDLAFEFDYDLQSSFRALIPVLALLDHFRIPFLAKYSGHRSLHLIVPAEAFPRSMRENPVPGEWMPIFDILADLFCCFSPELDQSSARLAKCFALTAPYSFHRYHGLLSIPINLIEAIRFDPAVAKLANFTGVAWRPDQLDGDGESMQNLIDLAKERLEMPETVSILAEKIFAGEQWESFVKARKSLAPQADLLLASLNSGLAGINLISEEKTLSKTLRSRLREAVLVMESPEAKEGRFAKLVAPWPFGPSPESTAATRQTVATALATWVQFGLDGAIDHLLVVCVDPELVVPATCAVRLLSLLPEAVEAKVAALQQRWETLDHVPSPQAAFVVLCLAELSPFSSSALPVILSNGFTLDSPLCRQVSSGKWQAEAHPDKAAMALCLGFGVQTVRDWIDNPDTPEATAMVRYVFGNLQKDRGVGKFVHAARKALASAEEHAPNRE